ncbi:nuclear pore complex protein Nup50 [Platichthys flesus]|uniref:nuclear pore complex protein Nup50 n=1 Tax=Platichthys flesus TaxID=8260 RepID=UPI002DBA83A1|nr:nuclear pore complex protein Nup50 [Platichthys flesus]XP_062238558.1 nuclear pore complex protein Nup50 [Platichthys flesus]
MAKRIADKELTDRNWDQEEEGEEAGQFSIASQDVLKSRVVKRAKRRNAGAEGENSGAFKGFKGFSLTKPAASSDSASTDAPATMFSGFGNGGGFQGLGSLTNGNGSSSPFGGFSAPAASTESPGLTFNGPSSEKPFAEIIAKPVNGSSPSPAPIFGIISGGSSVGNKEYSRQLTALNCSVRDWITKHVNDNPLCDLNPIFKDYEQHLASIERQYGAGAAAAAAGGSEEKKKAGTSSATPPPRSSSSSSSPAAPAPAAATLFSFGKQSTEDSTQDKSSTTAPIPSGITFNFGKKVDSSVLGSLGSKSMSPGFSFSSSSSASFSQTSMFGTPGSAAPLSFSGTKAVDAPPAVENGEEESEEPPKPDVREVKEDDAFLSKKCKMFYKKDSEFKEKGVGTLHLKAIEEGKTQLVIRADTNLGNILLNILVSASMPCTRVGKNNVMVVCVPNPVIDDKNPTCPIPLLIRVKTAEEADELHKTLEEKKA